MGPGDELVGARVDPRRLTDDPMDDHDLHAPGLGRLADAVLSLEAERTGGAASTEDDALDLPGSSEGELTLRDALRIGGTKTFTVLALLVAFDELESATLGTLAPDIGRSLNISDGTTVFITAASGAFLVLGSLPMGYLADRYRRGRIIGWASLVFSLMVFLSGLALNGFMLFLTRMGSGIAKSNQLPVQGSLVADTYPIASRGRVSAATAIAGRVTGTLSPLLVGAIASIAGGSDGWRWAYFILAVPSAIAALFAFRLPEPPRGQFEKQDVLGEVIDSERALPTSMEAAFSRLLQIRTIRTTVIAFAALGFGLFTVPVLTNLFLEERYGLGSFGRGVVATVSGVAVLIVLPFVGKLYDRLYRVSPEKALRLVGVLVLPAALLVPAQFFMPNAALFAILSIPPAVMLSSAFVMVGPLLASVTPYRLRGMGSALAAIYIFFIGATGGSLLSGLIVNAYSPRAAVITIFVPATVIGGFLILRSSAFIRSDLRMVVDELREEKSEHERLREHPDSIPALQVSHVDFSYGPVQILFDVSFEVAKGECVALLGTNGAGKSTILRVVAGLGTPSRGAVRHHGRSITYVSPEYRTQLGLRVLPGGKGIFADMTIRENVEMAAWIKRKDKAELARCVESALAMFPELEERSDERASSLSGGQQQLLAFAQTLATEPEILIIDELSLGLAPIMVERLVQLITDLRATGLTIIVVEQSLNVALAIADRAVFLEKGHVRFDGPLRDLVERQDLARAVFLGDEGG